MRCKGKRVVTATSAREPNTVKERVADNWFAEATIALDRDTSVLEIGYWAPCTDLASRVQARRWWQLLSRFRVPMRMTCLQIYRVDEWRVADHHGMGRWMFESISYDAAKRTIIVSGCPPVTVEARVREIEVAVAEEDEPSGYTVVWTPRAAWYRDASKVRPLDEAEATPPRALGR